MEEERKWTVYVHQNIINNKMYVGITSQNTKKRWQNGYGYIGNSYFYNSIKKHGWDGFYHEIITSKLTEQEAKEFEITLINYLNLTNKCLGYNLTNGGEGSNGLIGEKANRRHPIYKYNIDGNFVCAYYSMAEAMRDIKNSSSTNIPTSILNTAATKGYIAYGYKWSFIKFDHLKEVIKDDKSIYQYDKYGKLIEKFKGYTKVLEKYPNYKTQTLKVGIKELRISNGYFWCNDNNKSKLINKIQNAAVLSPSTIIPINKYSLTDIYISSYESISEVAKELNKKTSNILDVCLGVKNSAYGYKWRFNSDYLIFLKIDVNDIIRRKEYGKRCNSITPNTTSINNKITSEMQNSGINNWNQ